tara:strand:- start:10232 stop:11323 length:1092 start_codon:yes stop_codon:yes gene_type:complete
MHVLHVTDELSKKNYSISSLIFFLSDFLTKKYKIKHTILTNNFQNKIFKTNLKVEILNLYLFKNFLKTNQIILSNIKRADFIHIHGLWRWIHFISIFYCILNSKNYYIHSHGMLLKPALKNKGYINYFFKKFLIFLYGILQGDRAKFISITKKETSSIKSCFNKPKIKLIPNPIPSKSTKIQANKIRKIFVFFGRIHPIKNLELMINSFILANLGRKWNFHIYGIEDDKNYLLKIKKLIKNYENIKIKKPVFDNEKKQILNSSWINILLSKSEVLSLSVLEAASMQLPSIVNEKIQLNQFTKRGGISTIANINEVSKSMIEVSNWSLDKRKKKGKLLSAFIQKKFSIEKIANKYLDIYNLNYR